MDQVRVNLTLDETVWEAFARMVPMRKKSLIINELLKGEVERIKREQEEQALSAAFREASEDRERQAAIQEWESLDPEDWGERS
jgi:Arc/MetJ family transcription regulator